MQQSHFTVAAAIIAAVFFMSFSSAPAGATTVRKADMTCGYCGKKSEQRYLGSFSFPFPNDLDFQPAMAAHNNIQLHECPDCGYLGFGSFTEPPTDAVRQVMESAAFKKLKGEKEDILRRFLRLRLLSEARENFREAALDCLMSAWLLDPGRDAYESAMTKLEEREQALKESQREETSRLEYKQSALMQKAYDLDDPEKQEAREKELEARFIQETADLEKKHTEQWRKLVPVVRGASGQNKARALELRRAAVPLLEKALAEFAGQPEDERDMEEEANLSYLLVEMYRRVGDFEKVPAAADKAWERRRAAMGDEDEMALYAVILKAQKKMAVEKDRSRHSLNEFKEPDSRY